VAAVVAGVDTDFAQWPAVLHGMIPAEGKKSVEHINNAEAMMTTSVNNRKTHRGEADAPLPKKIFMHRDSLSEKQFKTHQEGEYGDIIAALTKFYSRKDSTSTLACSP
jgi:hypothetical protein